MKKTFTSLIFVFIIIVLPLLFKPYLLLNYKVIIIFIGGLLMFLTQPAFSIDELQGNRGTDRYSILAILLASAISVSASLIQWAYFSSKNFNLFFSCLGFLMILFGLIIRISSIITLGKYFTATARIINQHILIETGLYSVVRHPSYLGAILVMTGVPVLLNNLTTYFFSLILLLTAYFFRIKIEEKVLISIFGEQYLRYSLNVKKLIPYIW